MKHSELLVRTGVAIALGLVLLGCGAQQNVDSPAVDAAQASDKLEFVPDLALEDLEGNPVQLSEFDGTVRLIDFWATWCAPCREEIPMFKELHEEYGPQGFTMVAVSMDDIGAEEVREFLTEFDAPYLNLMGNAEIEEIFGPIIGYPMAFLVDREGRVVGTYIGAKPRKVLEQRIRDLLGLAA